MKRFPLLCVCLLLVAAGCGPKDDEGSKYGKTLVDTFKVPPETLVKFDEHKPSKRREGDSPLEAALLADTEAWSGPAIEADSTANPYKLVVTITGRLKEDGDAVSMWKAGWNLGEDGTRLTLMPGLTRSNLKAGQNFSATAVSDPISFKKDRPVSPVIELVSASNFEVNSVEVAVWSGLGGTSFLQKFGALGYAVIGLVMLLFWWIWFRRPKTDMDL
jgi:hypothetical protein